MKLVDRYILRSLFAPFVLVMIAFTMIFILWDLSDNLGDFIDAETSGGVIARYYLNKVPSSLLYIAPISLLLAVLYALYQLTRHSELTAMRASGISLYRLITPMVLFGVAMSFFVFGTHELIGARAGKMAQQVLDSLEQTGTVNADEHVHLNFGYKNIRENRTWRVERFDRKNKTIEGITFNQRDEKGNKLYEVVAAKAEWLDHQWLFYDVLVQPMTAKGTPQGPPEHHRTQSFVDLIESPQDFINLHLKPDFMSAYELRRYIRQQNKRDALTDNQLNKLRTDMHAQFAMPWACLIAVLLGAPFGHATARQGVMKGILLCLLTFLSYYFLYVLVLYLGKNGTIPAPVAAWSMNMVFLTIGLVLLRRMR